MYIQSSVIAVKEKKIVKIAVDCKELSKTILKDKYQAPNIDHFIGLAAEQLEKLEREAGFTSLDLQYAYSQIQLDTKAAEECNFQIICGEATGTYVWQGILWTHRSFSR